MFNALLGEERAIVTEVPGTTRDALEAVVSLGGYPFRLVDTAGLRETDERVERIGVEVARRYLRGADVVLFCSEGYGDLRDDEEGFLREIADIPVLIVRTKMDRWEGGKRDGGNPPGAIGTSVKTGEGLDELRQVLPSLVFEGLVQGKSEVPILTRRRHAEGLRKAEKELKAFREGLEKGLPAEVAATHLRPAESALEELLGVIPREEILDRLFEEFCIGK